MKQQQKQAYYKLEKNLKRQFKNTGENVLILTETDFKKGCLKNSSFIRLTEECWYIPYRDKVVIQVPDVAIDALVQDLGFFATQALYKIKDDRKYAIIGGFGLFATGVIVLAILAFFWQQLADYVFVSEFMTIISWVFIWSAVSKWFIEQRELQDKRFTILQLLSADMINEGDMIKGHH